MDLKKMFRFSVWLPELPGPMTPEEKASLESWEAWFRRRKITTLRVRKGGKVALYRVGRDAFERIKKNFLDARKKAA